MKSWVHYTLHGGMIYEEIEGEIRKMFSGRQKAGRYFNGPATELPPPVLRP